MATYCTTNSVTCVEAYAALVDPGTADTLLPAYDSGDKLHPNQAGLDAIATAVRTAFP